MNLGLIARADRTGLGVQTHGFYRHLQPAKTLVIDLSRLNRQKNDLGLYPGAKVLRHTPYPNTHSGHPGVKEVVDDFLDGLDIVLTCETPYDYYLFEEAARRGVKTVLQYNFELLDHLHQPDLPRPDLFIAPSLWRYDDVPLDNRVFIPVPVDRERFPYRPRTEAGSFLHIVGNPAMEDRNGTQRLIEAWSKLSDPRDLVIRTQWPLRSRAKGVSVVTRSPSDNAELYATGDVFVMPRKFGGLCLPLNEAMSLGMPVVMTGLSPQADFLDARGLVPARFSHQVMAKTMIDIYEPDVAALAAKVEELVASPDLVTQLSEHSNRVAEKIAWSTLKPTYERALAAVVAGDRPEQDFSWADAPALA